MIFWIFLVVLCHSFGMWHCKPICKNVDLSFIWGHHHLHLVDDRSINRLLHYLLHRTLTRPYKVETASCRPRLQFLALNLDSYHVVSLSFLRSISLASLLHLKSRDFEMLFMSAAFSKRYSVKKDQSRRIVRWQAFLEQYYLIFVNIMHVHIPCALL